MKRILTFARNAVVTLGVFYLGLAMYYWLGWPEWVRNFGSVAFVVVMLLLWYLPAGSRLVRRLVCLAAMAAVAFAYSVKTPVEQTWIPLHEKRVTSTIDGDVAHLANFRDAIHNVNEPSESIWTTRSFDLSQLEGAEFILQPFGNSKATEHAMITFRFSGGQHVVVSMEARRAEGAGFDPLAGFFRHDQLYPLIGTERDLVWKRLARDPPFEMQFYPLQRSPDVIRIYFERILALANSVDERPRFYNTVRESCLTSLIRLAPEAFASVPWYDLRQWIPGSSIGLFQDLGLVDDSLTADELRKTRTLRSDIASPVGFADDSEWSAYLRLQFDAEEN